MRQTFVVLHRYVGLVMALFLVVAGFTGIFIAFYDELDACIHPEVMRVVPPANQAMLSPVALTALVLRQYPDAMITRIDLNQVADQSRRFRLQPRPGLPESSVLNNEVFVNPYTGQILGERKWGDITQGTINLLPFIYRLHFSLALGSVGDYLFGIVALLWTLDCFVGAYLTFPAPQRTSTIRIKTKEQHWLSRWWKAWKIRWHGGSAKRNFDLHRAGGLWVWAMLFVFAWSSVAFNLREVYTPVMDTLFARQSFDEKIPTLAQPLTSPQLDVSAALGTGRQLIQQASHDDAFTIHHEAKIYYDASKGTYTYVVNSSRDLSEKTADTAVIFNANSGEQLAIYLPTGEAAGDTITQWLLALHTAQVWGLPMQIFVCAMGFGVVGLTVTGVLIWLKKRRSRKLAHQLKGSRR
ncbi:PepSY domain-containing protein [Methylophilus sp. OH31]|uniref:PepSY-associated TM helix domain-containing protein n=1 Tax=Methylophilus sp. OH31 TaxID=1387312 RepID=UPI000467C4D9|nr:PepSY-associated TM helix domain-containing protein [Methylophilus sp. OH31]